MNPVDRIDALQNKFDALSIDVEMDEKFCAYGWVEESNKLNIKTNTAEQQQQCGWFHGGVHLAN